MPITAKPLIVVSLISVGIVVLAALSLSLLMPSYTAEFRDEHGMVRDQLIPPIAGGITFIFGISLLLVKSKRAL